MRAAASYFQALFWCVLAGIGLFLLQFGAGTAPNRSLIVLGPLLTFLAYVCADSLEGLSDDAEWRARARSAREWLLVGVLCMAGIVAGVALRKLNRLAGVALALPAALALAAALCMWAIHTVRMCEIVGRMRQEEHLQAGAGHAARCMWVLLVLFGCALVLAPFFALVLHWLGVAYAVALVPFGQAFYAAIRYLTVLFGAAAALRAAGRERPADEQSA